eukprot:scaffold149_cov315-Pinguiococcus_pyrenoidosus.AAC.104
MAVWGARQRRWKRAGGCAVARKPPGILRGFSGCDRWIREKTTPESSVSLRLIAHGFLGCGCT